MKHIIIITNLPFWRERTGASNRIMTLANYLSKSMELKVIFAGKESPNDNKIFEKLKFKLIYLEKHYELSLYE